MGQQIIHIIGNGKKTRILIDKWQPEGVLVKQFGNRIRSDAASNRLTLVEKFLRNGEWNTGLVTSHLLMQTWENLQNMKNDALLGREQNCLDSKLRWLLHH